MSSTASKSLLIELGTEELPPKALDELAGAFAAGIVNGLGRLGIAADAANAQTYCSPRRLAVLVPAVATEQADQSIEKRGPALSAGLDAHGQPSKALLGFAHGCGVEVETLDKLETDKGAWFVHRTHTKGQRTSALLPDILAEAIKALPIPKPMRWGNHDHAFVRPMHWLVVLHGSDVVDAEIFGLKSSRYSRGHRFHHPQPVHIVDAESWLHALRGGHVVADPRERRERIHNETARVVAQTGGVARLSAGLLDEIANLTEWPVAIACTFERAFLEVPHEVLVTTMETNQKFVPLLDTQGHVTENFIGIANIESRQPAEIRKGYERVIRPRFADAKFFYDEDRKQPLVSYQEALKDITYQHDLGSIWDKTSRVAELARVIANRVGVDAGLATRAAALSKCDLRTRMVGEFPELQGIMGRYYAAQGERPEHAEVAQALDESYRPRFAGDAIATGKIAQVLAIAERIDTLAGIFAVGLKPSGNKDPFALRRSALGLARTLIEAGLDLDLKAQMEEALAQLPENALVAGLAKGKDSTRTTTDIGQRRAELGADLYEFIIDRLRGYYADQGFASDVFEAVRALAPSSLADFDRRMRAVAAFASLPEALALAAANKRIANILHQAGGSIGGDIERALLESEAEHALVDVLASTESAGTPSIAANDYVGTLQRLATLRGPIDRFFDEVMVMADDPAIRRNRVLILSRLRALFLRVADVSLLRSGSD